MWKLALLIAVLAFACVPISFFMQARFRRKILLLATVLAASAVVIGKFVEVHRLPENDSRTALRPIEVAGEGDEYAASQSCRDCHQEHYDSWHASYHRTMTQTATPASVIGDFNNVRARVYGHDILLMRKDDEFWVRMHDPELPVRSSSEQIERPVVMTTGSHHMQVYWYATGKDRRLSQLPIAWLNEARRWVPIHSIFVRPPQNSLGKTEARWNHTCIKCHTTDGRPRIDLAREPKVDTHVAEFGIACEACHGPGAAHVLAHASDDPALKEMAKMTNPAELDHRRSAEVCGQCHGVWTALDQAVAEKILWGGMTYRPGDKLSDTRHVFGSNQALTAHVADYLRDDPDFIGDRFWRDGMVRVSGREYNGLIRSPCFQKGTMSCLSCHELHPAPSHADSNWANDQFGSSRETNAACLQCHDDFRSPDGLTQHTHHDAQSSGSLCYNCHMPYTTYGLLKSIRSHQISSPSTQETVQAGRANACNLCHIDKTLPWAADQLQAWYGIEPPPFESLQRKYSATLLAALTGDAGQRVLAAATLGWDPARAASRVDWVAPILGQLLDDPYDAVRYVAHRSLKQHEGFEDFPFDFLGNEAYRDQISRRVYLTWRALANHGQAAPTLLMSQQGDLQHREFAELLGMRNERVVVLAE